MKRILNTHLNKKQSVTVTSEQLKTENVGAARGSAARTKARASHLMLNNSAKKERETR